mmetsp:Transcript_80994/g.255546  ORF Transcript_80994/g.255546 Transcript_80994/m.255546 type:complete len:334 (-) Transcript_80994:426-1427(-)
MAVFAAVLSKRQCLGSLRTGVIALCPCGRPRGFRAERREVARGRSPVATPRRHGAHDPPAGLLRLPSWTIPLPIRREGPVHGREELPQHPGTHETGPVSLVSGRRRCLLQQGRAAPQRTRQSIVEFTGVVVVGDEGLVERPVAVRIALAVVQNVRLPALRCRTLLGPRLVPGDRVGNHEDILPDRGYLVFQSCHCERILLAEKTLRLGPTVGISAPIWKHRLEVLPMENPRWACGVMVDSLVPGEDWRLLAGLGKPGNEVFAEVILLGKHLSWADLVQVGMGGNRLDKNEVRVQDRHHRLPWLCSLHPLHDCVGTAAGRVAVVLTGDLHEVAL